MKNIEKYKDEIIELMEGGKSLNCAIQTVRTNDRSCGVTNCGGCYKASIEWLLEEYKEPVKLTLAEKCILENINEKWEFIARDRNGSLYLYVEKPTKIKIHLWGGGEWVSLNIFKHLFQFIKWEDEEPYNTKELLANCEVVKKAK